jgi:GAF domain-containing protein
MSKAKETLTLADLAAVQAVIAGKHAGDEPYKAVEHLAQRVLGHRLFTVMRHRERAAEVERVYSNNTAAYPVGGRKQKMGTPWGAKVLDRGEVFIAANRDELREAFDDYELIFSLGIGSIMNVPISYGGRTLATMNISGEAGQYGDEDVPTAKALGALLLPVLLASETAPAG